jgi:hypothetical protein
MVGHCADALDSNPANIMKSNPTTAEMEYFVLLTISLPPLICMVDLYGFSEGDEDISLL